MRTESEKQPAGPKSALTARGRERFLWLFLCAFFSWPGLGDPAGIERVRLIQTSDLHGHLESSPASGAGGVLRVGSVIRGLRASAPTSHVIQVDCGDTCQGSLAAALDRGSVGIELLTALGVDIWVPGNHDLDFGSDRFVELTRRMAPRALCANLGVETGGETYRLPGWRSVQAGQAKIAVIGITAKHLSYWLWGDALGGMRPASGLLAVRRLRPEVLASRPDMIVLAAHQGWLENDPRGVNEIPLIVRSFPEIDLILGGHTHRQHPGREIGFRTWYVQPGRHGESVAVVDAVLDTRRHRVLRLESRLAPVDESTPEDPAVADAMAGVLARTAVAARARVGELGAAVAATGLPGLDCPISELISAAIAASAGTRVAVHGKLGPEGLPAGAVTEADLFAAIPYENSIAVAELTVAEIEQILAEQLRHRTRSAFNGIWGLYADVESGGRVRVRPPRDWREGQRLATAFNSYTVAGAGGRFPVLRRIVRRRACRLRDTETGTRDAVRAYLAAHPGLVLVPTPWLRFPD